MSFEAVPECSQRWSWDGLYA